MIQPLPPPNSVPNERHSHAFGFEQRLIQRIRAHHPPLRGPIAIGFSGGADSLALATAFARIAPLSQLQGHLIHVDHGIREESKQDAERTRELAERIGLPITVTTLPEGIATRSTGLGLEEVARRERYLTFRSACAELGSSVIALAHHRQDQAETVLLHLLRGAGLKGAAGMAESAVIEIPWWSQGDRAGLTIWRPLLNEPRTEIEAYNRAIGLAPIDDASNDDRRILRNWVRHDLLPSVERRQAGAAAAIARFAAIAAEEDAFVDSFAAAILTRVTNSDGDLVWADLAEEPAAVRRRVMWKFLERANPDHEISLDRVEAALAFCARARSAAVLEIGGGAVAVWHRGALLAGMMDAIHDRLRVGFPGPFAPDGMAPLELQSGGSVEIDGWRIEAGDTGPFRLRTATAGDRLAGSGTSVAEWARQRGVHPLLRTRLIVAESSGVVVWVAGPECASRPPEFSASTASSIELTKLEEAG